MKKYKLIKGYPGREILGTICNEKGIIYNKIRNAGFDGSKRLSNRELPFLKDSTFWEEVIKKDYEILSISTNSYVGISTSKIDIKAFEKGDHLNFKWDIHSVKRLSDNKVFTIGDNTNKGVIKEFLNYNNTIHASCKKEKQTSYFSGNIDKLKHIKKSLFTTDFEIIEEDILLCDDEAGYDKTIIKCVERLSDNVQFKIGERIKEGIITNIVIKKDKIYLEI